MSIGVEFMHDQRHHRMRLQSISVADRRGSRYEGIPLTSIDEVDTEHGKSSHSLPHVTTTAPTPQPQMGQAVKKERWYRNPKKMLAIVLPHVALIGTLLAYVSVCSLIVQYIEADHEVQTTRELVQEILTLHEKFVNDSWQLHLAMAPTNRTLWKEEMLLKLRSLTKQQTGEVLPANVSEIQTKWTFPSAVLYALTILTTCGYDRVAVVTPGGRIFSVAFALVGIPLMFVTAADIGKCLSEGMMVLVNRVNELVDREVNRYRTRHKLAATSTENSSKISADQAAEKSQDKELSLLEQLDNMNAAPKQSLLFPITAYVGLICLYCTFGGLMYTYYEDGWSFTKAFHFSFNTVTTVGLGDVDVHGWFYLALNVAYVIVGLSVVTMCIDLASTHLKAYFTRIHYFGRAARGVGDDIREMIRLISTVRRKKGCALTLDDLRDFLEAEGHMRPFIPQNANTWRYVDETSSQISTFRQNSVTSELLSSISSCSGLRNSSNRMDFNRK